MGNRLKTLKRALALIFVFMLSINSFAAIVSDNDGSAFVTKAEFEALKDSFNKQIANYNSSLEGKIDGAIASYLAGIQVIKEEELVNIYKKLGGNDIIWGWKDMTPTTAPKTGFAGYYLNSGQDGFNVLYPGAGYGAIQNSASSAWWNSSSGKGTYGKYLVYKTVDGDSNKYLTYYKEGLLEAIAQGAWFSNYRKDSLYWEKPLGSNSGSIAAPSAYDSADSLTVGEQLADQGTCTNWDAHVAQYRLYDKVSTDLSKYACSWNVVTTDVVSISEKDKQKVRVYERQAADSTIDDSGKKMEVKKIYIRGWNTNSNDKWTNLCPGFYESKGYTPVKIYQGVTFFHSPEKKSGTVTIKGFKLIKNKKEATVSNDIYFAISDVPFANDVALKGDTSLKTGSKGNLKFTDLTNVTEHDATNHIYKISTGANGKFKLEVEKDTYYYIKIQPTLAALDYDNTVYMDTDNEIIVFVENS